MRWLLNSLYLLFLLIASPWMLWRIVKGKSRRGWLQKLFGVVEVRSRPGSCLWLHAVSVGEVNLLQPIIDQLLAQQPELQIAISTSTETGYDLAIEKYSSDSGAKCDSGSKGDSKRTPHLVFFCPYDFSWAIKNVLKRIKPSAIVLAELELWPNLIAVAGSQYIPVVVINGRISENSYRGYQRFSFITAPMFRGLSMVMAQTKIYAERFINLGCHESRTLVSGSVKFDGVTTDPNNADTQRLAEEAGFTAEDFVFVAGSTQLEEDLIAAEVFRRLKPEFSRLKLVLVPRHPDRCQQLKQQLKKSAIDIDLRTEIDANRNSDRPLVVNVIGELGHWWGRANAAYVGGSMGTREGQNMIEPSAYAAPTSFGPRTKNFRDVVDQLLSQDAAVVVANANELEQFLRDCLTSPQTMQAKGDRARLVVSQNVGAAEKTAGNIIRLIADDN